MPPASTRLPRWWIAALAAIGAAGCLFRPSFEPGDERPIARLAAGRSHACAIDADSVLWCWGDNRNGQLGLSNPSSTGTPVHPDPDRRDGWTTVATNDIETCALHRDTVSCWGRGTTRQLALPSTPVRLFAGAYAGCAIDEDSAVWCWGDLDFTGVASLDPIQIPLPALAWQQLVFAYDHACARAASGEVVCWGKRDVGQLGTAPGGDVPVAEAIAWPVKVRDLGVALGVTCGIGLDDRLYCVGQNNVGQLGDTVEEGASSALPMMIDDQSWSQVALGFDHACELGTVGVACHGADNDGAMGDGFDPHLRPSTAGIDLAGAGLGAPIELVSGHDFSCARDADDRVACWGANRFGELGNGQIASSRTPVLAFGGISNEVVVGEGHTCITTEGPKAVRCWGDNRDGQANPENAEAFLTTATLVSGVMPTHLVAGARHTCAGLDTDIQCWGANTKLQLGSSPVTAPLLTTWTSLAAGGDTTCAVATASADGRELYCWGASPGTGASGQVPVSAPGGGTWSEVAVASGFGIGLYETAASDSRIALLGTADCLSQADPSRLMEFTGTTPVQLSAAPSGGHACVRYVETAVTQVRCLGDNRSRQLNNEAIECPTGPQVPALPLPNSWAPYVDDQIGISVAGTHSCALVYIGSPASAKPRVFCWGENRWGELGTLLDGGIPTQVNELEVSEVATSLRHTCAIGKASNGDLGVYCWGDNRFGELGNGKRFHERPVAVTMP